MSLDEDVNVELVSDELGERGVCGSEVSGSDYETCSRCGVHYCSDCWEYNEGKCAVYGCEDGNLPVEQSVFGCYIARLRENVSLVVRRPDDYMAVHGQVNYGNFSDGCSFSVFYAGAATFLLLNVGITAVVAMPVLGFVWREVKALRAYHARNSEDGKPVKKEEVSHLEETTYWGMNSGNFLTHDDQDYTL